MPIYYRKIQEDEATAGVSGNDTPTWPQRKYDGMSSIDPTCSEPTRTNRGCDAWGRCSTKGEGPYNVVYKNTKGVKNSCHCRLWMYKQLPKKGYTPQDDPWLPVEEYEFIDPDNHKLGQRVIRSEMFIENCRLPYPGAAPHDISEYPDAVSLSEPHAVSYDDIPPVVQEVDRRGNRRKDTAERQVGD